MAMREKGNSKKAAGRLIGLDAVGLFAGAKAKTVVMPWPRG
jgi:hypothetical protein